MKPSRKPPCSDGTNHRPTPPAKPAPADPARQKAEIELLIEKITDLVTRNPEKAATILTDWTKQPAGKTAPTRKKAA